MLCCAGYIVVCPEVFHEYEPVALAYDDPGTARGNALKVTKPLQAFDSDAAACVAYLRAHPRCNGRIASAGMCTLGGAHGGGARDPGGQWGSGQSPSGSGMLGKTPGVRCASAGTCIWASACVHLHLCASVPVCICACVSVSVLQAWGATWPFGPPSTLGFRPRRAFSQLTSTATPWVRARGMTPWHAWGRSRARCC
jgi:hypothetical protein